MTDNSWGHIYWEMIHTLGYNSITLQNVNGFISLIKEIVNRMPCEKCIKHANKYIKKHNNIDMTKRLPDGKYLGPFIWTCEFHNYVNNELGKNTISWIITKKKYDDRFNDCPGGCIDDGTNKNVTVRIIKKK